MLFLHFAVHHFPESIPTFSVMHSNFGRVFDILVYFLTTELVIDQPTMRGSPGTSFFTPKILLKLQYDCSQWQIQVE